MTRTLRILLPIGIMVGGLIGTVLLVRSKPRLEPTRPELTLPLVRVISIQKRDVPLTVRAQGTVEPRTETTLAAQVAAQVVTVGPSFEVGRFFEHGEVLLTLDPRDFGFAVAQAKAQLAQARLRLAEQEAEARVARMEWRELGSGDPDPLVLREPQIAEARAALAAAEADLGKAQLDLERTRIRAPFQGRLRRKEVDVGQFLTPGQVVATVHAIDYAEVRLPISQQDLAFLDISLGYRNGDESRPGPMVSLSAAFSGRRSTWLGRIVRSEGELDSRSRMIHLVARVEDPYVRDGNSDRPPLAIGLFVEATITGHTIKDAALVPRSALRDESRLMVVDEEDRLRFRSIEVIRVQGDNVVVGDGLETGERVCISPLDTVVDGMAVRIMEINDPAMTDDE